MGYASALILSYPVVTMCECAHEPSRRNLLGDAPSPEMLRLTSVEQNVSGKFPPTFLWWGGADKGVDPENSRMLRTALRQSKIPCVCREFTGVGHGVGLGKGLPCEGWIESAVQFWELQRRK